MSRQAVSKHLALLQDAGLVVARGEVRGRRYELTPAPLADALGWMVDVGAGGMTGSRDSSVRSKPGGASHPGSSAATTRRRIPGTSMPSSRSWSSAVPYDVMNRRGTPTDAKRDGT